MPRSMPRSLPAEGEVVWVKGVVSKITPNAILVVFQGPGGAPMTVALSPKQTWESEGDTTPAA